MTQRHPGRSKSITGTQQEHNGSIARMRVPLDLAAVVDAWEHLLKPIKDGILAMVEAASENNSDI